MFAKRRKKADKWVVDESSIGSTAPSQFADHFLQQQSFQQQQFQMQQQQEYQVQKDLNNRLILFLVGSYSGPNKIVVLRTAHTN